MSSSTHRYWISWWGGDGADCRPCYVDLEPPFAWWCSGERDEDPPWSICAVIDAQSEEAAAAQARMFWPEYEARFCHHKPAEWMPDVSRFPRKSGSSVKGQCK